VPALLPGADLVEKGLSDLAAGRETIESLLVASARTRLRQLGYSVTEVAPDRPESRLYELVETEVGVARAHARYNALRRRLVSFLKATRRPVVTSRGAAPE
jgi:hypothetical protein